MDNKRMQELVKKVNTMDKQSIPVEKAKEVQSRAKEKHLEKDSGREVER